MGDNNGNGFYESSFDLLMNLVMVLIVVLLAVMICWPKIVKKSKETEEKVISPAKVERKVAETLKVEAKHLVKETPKKAVSKASATETPKANLGPFTLPHVRVAFVGDGFVFVPKKYENIDGYEDFIAFKKEVLSKGVLTKKQYRDFFGSLSAYSAKYEEELEDNYGLMLGPIRDGKRFVRHAVGPVCSLGIKDGDSLVRWQVSDGKAFAEIRRNGECLSLCGNVYKWSIGVASVIRCVEIELYANDAIDKDRNIVDKAKYKEIMGRKLASKHAEMLGGSDTHKGVSKGFVEIPAKKVEGGWVIGRSFFDEGQYEAMLSSVSGSIKPIEK